MLQAVRLAGVANQEAVLDRTLLTDDEVRRALAAAATDGTVERFCFGGTTGWIITAQGAQRLEALLRDEAAERAAIPALERTLTDFEPLNGRFVGLLSSWQLQSTSPTTTGFGTSEATAATELLTALGAVGQDLRATLDGLIQVMPRFERYPAQYTSAVHRAHQEGLRWITGVGLLSCHLVWAELHQDLLSSLGRDRLDGRRAG